MTGKPASGPGLQSLPHALLDGRVEVAGHRAAEHLLAELELGVRQRLQLEEDVAVLTRAAGLLLVLVLGDRLGRDRLAVGHARQAELDVDAEAPGHPVEGDLHVRLAESGEDRLAAARVAGEPQRRIFLDQPLQRRSHLVEVGLGLGMDRGRVRRAGEVDTGERDRLALIAEGVAGHHRAELGHRADISGADGIGVDVLFAAREEELAEPFVLAARRIPGVGVRFDRSRVDAQVGDASHVGIGHRLEGEGDGRTAIDRALTSTSLPFSVPVVRASAADGNRSTMASRSCATPRFSAADPHQHRDHDAVRDALLESGGELLRRDRLVLQIPHHQLFVLLGDRFDELTAVELLVLFQFVGDGTRCETRPTWLSV